MRLETTIRVLLLAALVAVPAVAHADEPPSTSQFSATVLRNGYTQPAAHLAHNVPDLRVTIGDKVVTCSFLSHYQSTGT